VCGMRELDLLWVDIETTGLKPERDDSILEISVARSKGLGPLGTISNFVCYYPSDASAWGLVDPAVTRMHTENGLRVLCGSSTTTLTGTCDRLLAIIGTDRPVLAGSSVHFDRSFLAHDAPRVVEALHYRNLDVSSVRAFCYACGMPEIPKTDSPHRATVDLIASHALYLTCAEWLISNVTFDNGYLTGYRDAELDYADRAPAPGLLRRIADRILCRGTL
jgi:oligoribonuclease